MSMQNVYIGPYMIIKSDDVHNIMDELDIVDFVWSPEYLQTNSQEVWIANFYEHQINLDSDVMYNESYVRHNMANLMQKFKSAPEYKKLEYYLNNNNIEFVTEFGFCAYYN